MTQYIKQQGSSAIGLLTASAIFVGLIAYTNFFAFEKKSTSGVGHNSQASLSQGQKLTPVNDVESVAEVTPSSEGVSDPVLTIAVDTADKAASEIEAVAVAKTTPSLDKKLSDNVQASADKKIPAVAVTAPSSSVPPSEVIAPPMGENSPSAVVNNGQYQGQYQGPAYQNYNQYGNGNGYGNSYGSGYGNSYGNGSGYGNAYGNGYGNAQGNSRQNAAMNGDGQFDFDMTFSSRANMNADANTDMNGQLQNDYAANQAMYYQNQQQNDFTANYNQSNY